MSRASDIEESTSHTSSRRPEGPAAAVLAEPGRVAFREMSLEEPGAGELRVRLQGCGVCGSNVPPFEGRPWFDYPFAPGQPGHEGWGIVEAVGPEVPRLEVGDRVATLGDRAFATHAIVDADSTVCLPDRLDGEPFPAEPLACAMNVFRRCDIEAGQTVTIVGAGFLGCLLCQLASGRGARVAAVSRRPFSREMAIRCGAEEAFALGDREETTEAVREWAGGDLCDRVVEATGKQQPLTLAGELCRVRGRLIIAGYHQDGPREIDMQTWNWRGLDVVNAHERDPAMYVRGMRQAIEAVADGALAPYALFTHRYPLARLEEALRAARDRPDGFMKALVTPKDAP
jgi:threonine dehydrogenase-like Zn-dependent dehydrogenase